MAVTLTGTGGLFTRLGKIGNIINVVNTFRGTTIVADVDELEDNYNNDRDLSATVQPGLSGFQSGQNGLLTNVRSVAQNTLITMVNDDNEQEDKSVAVAMAELITQMEDNSDSVDGNTASITETADGSNNGDGIINSSTKNVKGKVLQYLLAEDIVATVSADSQSNGATVGRETFTIQGEANESNKLSWLYPKGSGGRTSITCIDASGDNAGNNLLTNSDFETFTVTNTPDSWDVDVGSVGTDIKETSESTKVYGGSKALEYVGDSATGIQISQTFDDDTAGTLLPLTQYSVNLWLKFDSSPAAGVLTIDLYDGSSVINDNEGTANSFTIDLTAASTSFVAYNGVFRTPRVLPSTIKIRVRISTALSTGTSIFIDHLSMGVMSQAYAGGPYLAAHSGATKFINTDFFTIAVTNNSEGDFQLLFDKLFSMRQLGLQLPFNTGGSETISDSLIG